MTEARRSAGRRQISASQPRRAQDDKWPEAAGMIYAAPFSSPPVALPPSSAAACTRAPALSRVLMAGENVPEGQRVTNRKKYEVR